MELKKHSCFCFDNDCGFDSQLQQIGKTINQWKGKFMSPSLHVKFVDDLIHLEAFNLEEVLITNHVKVLLDTYHTRTGWKFNLEMSQVYHQLSATVKYPNENQIKLYQSKLKFILFNQNRTQLNDLRRYLSELFLGTIHTNTKKHWMPLKWEGKTLFEIY